MNRNIFNPALRQASGARVTAEQSAGSTAEPAYTDPGQVPVIPLPNPGEGGPVYPGDMSTDPGQVPVIPLPNPGEGGPVSPGDTDTGIGGDPGQVPVIPLPNPGEGGPVYPGPSTPSTPITPGTSQHPWTCPGNSCITTILPTVIGSITGWSRMARVRFLNAAYNYRPFRIFISNTQVVNLLNYASASSYLQKTMPFQVNTVSTIAIINTASGLDLLQITDTCCAPTNGYSSFRIGNLAYNSGPMDVLMSDGRVVYSDLRYKEIGAFKRIMPGVYQFFYADTNLMPMPSYMDIETLDSAWLGVYPPHETFGSLYLDITSNAIYSVYLLQSGTGRNQIQNLILMDR